MRRERTTSRGRRSLVRVAAVGLVAAGLLTMPSASGQQQDSRFPNLPLRLAEQSLPTAQLRSMVGSETSTLAYLETARQWVQAPSLFVVADTLTFARNATLPESSPQVQSCRRYMGATSSRCEFTGPPGLDFNQKFAVVARAYPSNWSGDDPAFPSTGPAPLPIGPNQRRFAAEFTNFPAQPVRLIAFGTLPVEATLHLSLPSDSTGLPRGLRVDTDNFVRTSGGSQVVTDSVGSGSLVVRISDVKVDGVPLDVGPSCRVAKPAPIKLSGVGTPNFGAGQAVPPGTYNALFGGLLQGTLTIGSFSGCGNGSENLDPLVNSLGGNITAPVQIVQAQVNANCFNDNPRLALTASSCNRQGVLPYPAGSELPALLPSVAPAPPQDRNRVNPVDDSP